MHTRTRIHMSTYAGLFPLTLDGNSFDTQPHHPQNISLTTLFSHSLDCISPVTLPCHPWHTRTWVHWNIAFKTFLLQLFPLCHTTLSPLAHQNMGTLVHCFQNFSFTSLSSLSHYPVTLGTPDHEYTGTRLN